MGGEFRGRAGKTGEGRVALAATVRVLFGTDL